MKHFLLILLIVFLQIPVIANNNWSTFQEEKEKTEAELKIYPNPVKNNQVTISFQTKEITEVRFVNITGKEVLKQVYDFPAPQKTILLNEVPNGLYIIQIKTSEDQVIAKKLMISRN